MAMHVGEAEFQQREVGDATGRRLGGLNGNILAREVYKPVDSEVHSRGSSAFLETAAEKPPSGLAAVGFAVDTSPLIMDSWNRWRFNVALENEDLWKYISDCHGTSPRMRGSTVRIDTYREDPLYPRIVRFVAAILQRGKAVAPVDVPIDTGLFDPKRLEDWRHGQIPCLEKAIDCNLTRFSRLLSRRDGGGVSG